MSKKIVKHKTARFALEPDGFSIHTFELSRKLKPTEYYAMKDQLYRQQEQSDGKPWIHKDSYGNHICQLYTDYGINSIRLEYNQSADTYYLRMVGKLFRALLLKMTSTPINLHGRICVPTFAVITRRCFGNWCASCVNCLHPRSMNANFTNTKTRKRQTAIINITCGLPAEHMSW